MLKQFNTLVQDRTIDIYDGDETLAEGVRLYGAKQVTLYKRGMVEDTQSTIVVHPYRALLEASDCSANVCILNNNAVKVLLAMYPSAPKLVLVRFAPRLVWLLGFFGLVRRLIFGYVRIQGLTVLKDAHSKRTWWLVLEQSGGFSSTIPVLPEKVGIQVFLDWLKAENIKYVVLRFYEKLPNLYRPGGDLDMLVSDEDRPKVLAFIQQHESLLSDKADDIPIGLHSVSGEPGMIPYYPPPKARQILEHAITGPAGSRIPSPQDALHSFIYHVLYHSKKGYASGIPSTLVEHTDTHPENDYAGVIKRMAEAEGVVVGETMESLDEYMAEIGWRPKLDTLAKIAETNAWARDRFFAHTNQDVVGLSVFVLREWVLERNLLDAVRARIETEGYTIVRSKVLSDSEKEHVRHNLRGGTWGANEDGTTTGWLPAAALVIVDLQCVRMPPAYALGFERFRIRKLKEEMRSIFDADGFSSMHSTDNSHESWEYIETCFPDEVEAILEEVTALMKPSRIAMWRHILKPSYIKHSFKHILRSFVVRKFLS